MTCHLTVAIPTYNGAQRLPQVLDRLLHQQGLERVQWEVLVVDNNSTDSTADLVSTWQRTWKKACPTVPLHYLKELRQGATYARQAAVGQAQGAWIAFLDDDNIPTLDWLVQALTFIDAKESSGNRLGAVSGQIHGVFPKGNPPDLIHYVRPFLAIVERGDRPFPYTPQYKVLPPSAGLVVRREAWLGAVPKRLILGGRTDDSMLTSEDLEILVYLQRRDWEIWYNPAMEIDHRIPQHRLERNYLLPFLTGIGLTRSTIRMLRVPPWQRPLWTIAYGINDLRRLILHLHRSRRSPDSSLLTECQTTFFKSTLISPGFMTLWRIRRWVQQWSWQQPPPSPTAPNPDPSDISDVNTPPTQL